MGKRILIVDDEPDMLTITTFRLGKAGYEINTASHGMEAMRLIESDPPDLVLLDLRLPGMSGYDICNKMKRDERLKKVPVILFTASATHAMVEKITETGADDYIIKPFDADNLLVKIKKLIG